MTVNAAYYAVRKAAKKGRLPAPSACKCERCGNQAHHRHHEDYSRPLDVVYLCTKCHVLRHTELGWGVADRANAGRPRKYNFSKIPVGSYALIKVRTAREAWTLVGYHSRLTGERFKCFRWDDKAVVFRIK